MSIGQSSTPLGKVRGLGSAREGGEHWLTERVTSIALLISRVGHDDQVERIELMRPAAGTTKIDDAGYVDLTPHPWAGLPVVARLEAADGIGQQGRSEPQERLDACTGS